MSTVGLCLTGCLQPWDTQAIKELTTLNTVRSIFRHIQATSMLCVRTSPTLFMKLSLPFSVESLLIFIGEGAVPSITKTRLTPAE